MTYVSLQPVERFDVAPHDRGDGAPSCTLTEFGKQTPLTLDGLNLEAQFAVEPGYVLILSDGSPYEESLRVYLLTPQLSILDAIELSAPYTPGLFAQQGTSDDTRVAFTFDGAARYELRLIQTPRRFVLLPPGARRPLGWSRPKHLELRRLRAK